MIKKTLALALLFSMSSTSTAQVDNNTGACAAPQVPRVASGNNILRIDVRPRYNYILPEVIYVELQSQTVRAARHHIIPYETLRSFHNSVIDRDRVNRGELQIFSEFFLHLINIARNNYANQEIVLNDIRNAERVANLMRDGSINGNTSSFHGFQEDGISSLQTMYVWMPGNIFIGPLGSYRWDDPNNHFEHDADVIVGDNAHRQLYDIYLLMQAYINNRETVQISNGETVDVNIRGITDRLLNIRDSVYLFNGGDWSSLNEQLRLYNPFGQLYNIRIQSFPPDKKNHAVINRLNIKSLPDINDSNCIIAGDMLKIYTAAI